jgi:tRNA A-37 threonylcarbamoyl transferase component Bud32
MVPEQGVTPFGPDLSVVVRHALQDRYEIVAEIGRGAHAIVYQAIQRNLERMVALKVLRPHLAGNDRFVKRFHQEARSIAQLRHPNIVTIHDEGVVRGVHYMAMEYLEGENLQRLIARRRRLTSRETVHIAAQIARALDYAHARGLIHRDVKSGNIIVTGEGRAVLMDFGIAHPKSMPHGGSIIGTPEFMSPEQAAGKTVDPRTDFYGLGAVMYHALSGRTPFESGDGLTTLRRIAQEEYRPLGEIAAVEPWLEAVIDRCLRKDPQQRIGRGEELLAWFADHGMPLAGLSALVPEVVPPGPAEDEGPETVVPDAPDARTEPGRRRVHILGWALLGGLLLAIAGYAYVTATGPSQSAPARQPALPAVRAAPPPLVMPDLVGLGLAEARDSLRARGLVPGPVLRALAAPAFAGKVFKQIPRPGAPVDRGGKIILHVGAEE